MFLVQIASYHYCTVICIVDVHRRAKRWSPYKAILSPTALRVLLQYIMVAFRKKEYLKSHRQRFPTVLGASYLSREIFSKLRIFEFALCTAARRQRRYQFKDDQILFSPPLNRSGHSSCRSVNISLLSNLRSSFFSMLNALDCIAG